MGIIGIIDWFLKVINNALDVMLPWIGLAGLIGFVFYLLAKDIKKYNQNKKYNREAKNEMGENILQAITLLLIEAFAFLVFWWLPARAFKWTGWGWLAPTLRWVEFYIILIIIAYLFGHKYGEKRWIYSASGHFAVILFGWLVDHWMGIFFISLPLILTYYIALYRLAMVVLPANDPDDMAEKRKRFFILAAYTWGTQFPIFVVADHAWKKPETRIAGMFTRNLPIPGLIWTKSHQAVGITSGTQFKRVDGPGVVYMGRMERPFQVIDLRSQLRTSEIDVVSKDGISFKARVFTAFRIDPESWDETTYDQLRPLNASLRGAAKLNHDEGSFPFSKLRIQATLGTTSTKAAGDTIIYWDQWVLNAIEDAARKIISQKTLDELWRPADDNKEANALDVIAEEIKASTALTIRAAGILLDAARIVNFRFPTTEGQIDHISKQQITTWGSEWERKRTKILDEAQAQSEQSQQEARAYAESLLLNSIAEGLQKTQEIHPRLPRYVIAVRFLSALQDYIHKKPEEGEESIENDQRVQGLHAYLRTWQDQFLSSNSKEKL